MVWRRISGASGRLLLSRDVPTSTKWIHKKLIMTENLGKFPPTFYPLPLRALRDSRRSDIALIDRFGTHSYGDISLKASSLSELLLYSIDNAERTSGDQIAILVPNDHRYVVCQWAAWLTGLCVVPMHHGLPESLLDYHIKDSQSRLIIVSEEFREKLAGLHLYERNILVIPEHLEQEKLEAPPKLPLPNDEIVKKCRNQMAQILYTSGTTGPPKGVIATHLQLQAQAAAVAMEWYLDRDDTVLHHLPLHHAHGIVNGLLAPLFAGAKVHMLPKFSPREVWEQLLQEDNSINVMMGVPTMYAKLIAFAKEQFPDKTAFIRDFLRMKLRLCTCGSASLPDSILNDWKDLSGHVLLERYGMSEFGMGLGNPLAEEKRKIGSVGRPFPGIRVRISKPDAYSKSGFEALIDGDKYNVKNIQNIKNPTGDLLIKGPQVFKSYFNRPEETKKSFTDDGWFITGDIASYDGEAFKILGRSSVDIIKCGGYKVSALDVERVLLEHSDISEAAVVGLPDPLYGEKIIAVMVVSKEVTLREVQRFSEKHLPKHSIPSQILIVESIPRNALGKVNKMELKKDLFPNSSAEKRVI